MYPNVPTRRVGSDALPTSVSFVNPKSATCNVNDLVQMVNVLINSFLETEVQM